MSNVNNDNKKNQEIKNDLARIIFITSEAIRFGSDLKYFNHYKNKSKMEQVEFKNIPNDVQNVINDSEKSINWKNYLEQLRGGWKKASKYIESIEFGKKEIFKKLDNEIDYFNVANYFLFNKKLVEKYNFKIYLDSYFKDKILNKYSNIPQLWKQINENYKIKNKIEIIGLDKLLLSELKEYYNYINNKEIKKVLEKINQKKEFKTKIKIKKEKLKKNGLKESEAIKKIEEDISVEIKMIINNKLLEENNDLFDFLFDENKLNKIKNFLKKYMIELNFNEEKQNFIIERFISKIKRSTIETEIITALSKSLIISHKIYDDFMLDQSFDFFPKYDDNDKNIDKNFLSSLVIANNKDILKLILLNNVNVNINNNLLSPLNIAINDDNLEIVNILLDAGANPNLQSKNGYNSLHFASERDCSLEIIEKLINNGANINVQDNDVNTPLQIAIKNNHKEIANLLIENYADVNKLNYLSKPPLQIATFKSKINEIINQLNNSKKEELNKRLNQLFSKKPERKDLYELSELIFPINEPDFKELFKKWTEEKIKKLKELLIKNPVYVTIEISKLYKKNNPFEIFNKLIIELNKEISNRLNAKIEICSKLLANGLLTEEKIEEIKKRKYKTKEELNELNKEIKNIQNENIKIKNQNNFYDVPADNSCLFWAVASAYLLPVRNNNEEFKTRFIQLFSEENLKYLQLIQKLLKQYDLENNRNLNQLWYQDQTAINLVTNIFRNRVVDYIERNLDTISNHDGELTFRNLIQENNEIANNYLARMREQSEWGGTPEILAMANILNDNISVNNDAPYQPINQNSTNTINIFHVNNGTHYNFSLLENIEVNNTNSQETTTTAKNQQKANTKSETGFGGFKSGFLNEHYKSKNNSTSESTITNIVNSQTTTKKAINKYNSLSKEEKQQKLNEINQHYQTLSENNKKAFKDKLRNVGLGLTSTGISGAGILGVSKMTGISPIKGLSTTANYIRNSLSATETGEAVEMTPLLSEGTVAEGLTAAETLSVTEGTAVVATEGAVIGSEAGAAAALAPETIGLSLVIGGLAIAGTAIIWWLSNHDNNSQAVKHESHNQYDAIEKYYKFLAHDQLKLDINSNEWNKIRQIYQENENNYQEFKNKIKSEIINFYKEDHSGWGESITDNDINTLINIIYNHFQEINNHFSSNLNHGWKIVTNTIGSYFIIEEE